jgi:hypothetical protein
VRDALCYSSRDCRCPSDAEIKLSDRDKVIRAIERYEHHEISDTVAALKRLLGVQTLERK